MYQCGRCVIALTHTALKTMQNRFRWSVAVETANVLLSFVTIHKTMHEMLFPSAK